MPKAKKAAKKVSKKAPARRPRRTKKPTLIYAVVLTSTDNDRDLMEIHLGKTPDIAVWKLLKPLYPAHQEESNDEFLVREAHSLFADGDFNGALDTLERYYREYYTIDVLQLPL